jgi:hypothetical protein
MSSEVADDNEKRASCKTCVCGKESHDVDEVASCAKCEKENSLVIQEEAAWVGPVSLAWASTIFAMIVAIDILFSQGMSPCRVVDRIE